MNDGKMGGLMSAFTECQAAEKRLNTLEHASVKLQRIRRDRGSSGIPEARSRR
jgi:hypothetical protein